jgi:hypothetical protein
VAFEGAMTDLCEAVQRDQLYYLHFAYTGFGFNGDVILSVA